MEDSNQEAEHFLQLIRRSRKGKFKIYIGMSAGVGKTFRMLQEARMLQNSGVDVLIGYVETHGRQETEALLEGLPVVPRRRLFYKGKELEEMDVQAILNLHPEIVIVDELAHTNIEGSKNAKRWQDVADLLHAGIHVISAVNIQHIESLSEEVRNITGVEIAEKVPDKVLQMADEVVNIDLTAEELITRLKQGRIYAADKVPIALQNFFRPEKILQLRELALKEVAGQVERKIETELPRQTALKTERFLACIGTNHETAKKVIRKTARLASYYNSKWFVLYVQTPREDTARIGLAAQRHLINNFRMATEMGAEVITLKHNDISGGIISTVEERRISTVCIGKPHLSLLRVILRTGLFNRLLKKLAASETDIIILS